jgi:dihydroorotate dehydrogenase
MNIALCLLKILRLLPPETAHNLLVFVAKYFWFLMPRIIKNETKIHILGKSVNNCYGVAAGLDKNADCIRALFKMGFGIVEVGTVTPLAQKGNKKPRVFKFIKERSILNFMGFPGNGVEYALRNVKKHKREDGQLLGVNIGRNKDGSDADYIYLISKFYEHCDYITINISSPNTPNLRDTLDNMTKLENLLKMINTYITINNISTPIVLKLSPDSTSLREIYTIACQNGIAGFILTNTTVDRSGLPKKYQQIGTGGVSGALLREKSRDVLKEFNKINVHKKVVISVGGIEGTQEAMERLKMGANCVQMYTGLMFPSRTKHKYYN